MLDQLRMAAQARGGVFTVEDIRRAGVERAAARRLLRRGLWTQVRRGVYVEAATLEAASPAARHAVAAAAEQAVSAGRPVASVDSAATIHGLPLLALPDHWPWFGSAAASDAGRVHLTVPPGRTRLPETPAVHWYRASLPRSHVVKRHGVLVTSVARTVIDIARHRPFAEALAVADAALHSGACTVADLESVLLACRRWPGINRASRVVPAANGLAESPLESVGRVLFDAGGLPAPELQVALGDDDGFVGRVDFLLRAERTICEADGRGKYTDQGALFAEKRREDRLRELGFVVVRLTWSDIVHYPARSLARLHRAILLGRRIA